MYERYRFIERVSDSIHEWIQPAKGNGVIRQRQSGHTVLIIVIVVVALAILGTLGWLFWKNFINKTSSNTAVTTFAQCKAATGSKTLLTFPEQCVTADGQTFTGPSNNNTADEVTLKTYCTDAEKICFEYPEGWTIEKQAINGETEPGFKADALTVTSPNKDLALGFQSGISGIGGTCDVDSQTEVTILDPTPVASLSGYSDQYNVDVPYVLREVMENGDGKYAVGLLASTKTASAKAGTVGSCDVGFASFIKGRNSVLSSDYSGAGLMEFGKLPSDQGALYASRADAIAAFDDEVFKQGASIIASLHYN